MTNANTIKQCEDNLMEMVRTNDCSKDVESVMHSLPGFEALPETNKHQMLLGPKGEKDTPLKLAIQEDNVEMLQLLLQLMPLYNVVHREHIPATLTWVKNVYWMTDTLKQNKARWSPQLCKCSSESVRNVMHLSCDSSNHPINPMNVTDSSLDTSKLCVLTQLAFSVLASELFCYACQQENSSTNCAKYLLDVAPVLIHCTAKQYGSSKLPLNLAWEFGSPLTATLIQRQAPFADIGNAVANLCMEKHYAYDREQDTKKSIQMLNLVIERGRKQEMENLQSYRLYQERKPQTLMSHFIGQMKRSYHLNKMFSHPNLWRSHMQALFVAGVEFNANHETASAMMIRHLIDAASYQMLNLLGLLEALLIVLPIFGHNLPEEYHPSNITVNSKESAFSLVLNIMDALMGCGGLTDATPILCDLIHKKQLIFIRASNPCTMCRPATTVFYKAMVAEAGRHGCINIVHSPNSCNSMTLVTKCINGLLNMIVSSKDPLKSTGDCVCGNDASSESQPCLRCSVTSQDCCAWTLLEMLMNLAATQMKLSSKMANSILLLIARLRSSNSTTDISRLTTLVNLMWRYAYRGPMRQKLPGILSMPHRQSENGTPLPENKESEQMKVESAALLAQINSVLPLKTLVRMRIRHLVCMKDLDQLALPTSLKRYLRLGDNSHDHVINEIDSI